MKNIPHRVFKTLLLVFMLNINTSIVVGDQISFAKEILNEATSAKCSNYEYLNCLGMNESKCSKLMLDAFNSCPLKYSESLNEETFDYACNANQFLDLSGISPELFKVCGKYLYKNVNSTR